MYVAGCEVSPARVATLAAADGLGDTCRMRMTPLLVLALGACSIVSCGPLRRAEVPRHDLLITNGRILDGTGNPWFRGEVAIDGDRIAYVGPPRSNVPPARRATRVFDAADRIVAPGFIDMLGHSELTILRNPTAISKVSQGITSEITGEVNSAWPNTRPDEPPPTRAPRCTDSTWTSLDGYFRHLECTGVAINIGTYVAAGSVRRAVMGDASRRPTADELARMEALVEQAMREGAMGFSTGLIYAPSTFFTTEELIALARRAAAYGGGYASHIRSEGDGLLDAIREAIRIGAEAGTWVQIRHLKASGERNWGRMREAVALIDSARRAGLDVTADQYPYIASGTGLSAILPTWVQAGGRDSMLTRLADSSVRARLRVEREGGEWSRPPDRILVDDTREDSLAIYEGRRLDEIGAMRSQDPYEAAFDILVADSGRTGAIFFSMSEDDLRLAMRQPWVSIGQDAGARSLDTTGRGRGHPRGFGTFPRILGRYVREDSVLTLEDAVRKMTSLPAQRVGLAGRGQLEAGWYADVVVFDPATVTDRATFEAPQQLAEGIALVVVNGVPVYEHGRPTGALPGRALRGPGVRR
jgi:dihydroorotase/N-acyl-D-amino-acid deacylase